MGHKLTGDQFRGAHKKMGEIHRQLSQTEYPFDPDRLLGALNAILEGRFEAAGGSFPSEIYAHDLIPEYTDRDGRTRKWEILEDVAPILGDDDLKINDLEFISFLEGKETVIDGKKMRKCAVKLGANLGLSDGKCLLAHQEEIPTELRGKYIALPGTLGRGPSSHLHVAYLVWNGDRWCLSWRWLGLDWSGHDRLARRKSK